MWRRVEAVGGFLYRHRTKVAAGALTLAAIGVCTVVYLSTASDKREDASMLEDSSGEEDNNKRTKIPSNLSNSDKASQMVRRLGRIHEQYEQSLQVFVPTLHLKIVNVVDVSSTIRRIKELRATRLDVTGESEDHLWEEIKVSSFALVLVSGYMLCVVSVLLRVQLHMIDNPAYRTKVSARDDSIGKQLIEGTYAHLFDHGIEALYLKLRPIVAEKLVDWRVRDKLNTEYSELVRMLSEMRSGCEESSHGLSALLKTLLIPEDEMSVSLEGVNNSLATKALHQLWDVIESPQFATLVSVSLASCFQKVNVLLQRQVFFPDNPMGVTEGRTPPLASLLPQLKLIALKLVPKEGAAVAVYAKEVASGPVVDNLCLSLLDSSHHCQMRFEAASEGHAAETDPVLSMTVAPTCGCKADTRLIHPQALLLYSVLGTVTAVVSVVSLPINLVVFFIIDQAAGFLWFAALFSFVAGITGTSAKTNSSAVLVYSIVGVVVSVFCCTVDGTYATHWWRRYEGLHIATLTVDAVRLACVTSLMLFAALETSGLIYATTHSSREDNDNGASPQQSHEEAV